VGALLPVLGHPSGAVARRARVMTADPDVAVARPLPMAGKPDHGAARPGRWRRNGLGRRRRRRHRRIALRRGAEADGKERYQHECDADERSERRCQSSYSGSDYAAPNISIAASRRPRHASAEAWPIGRGRPMDRPARAGSRGATVRLRDRAPTRRSGEVARRFAVGRVSRGGLKLQCQAAPSVYHGDSAGDRRGGHDAANQGAHIEMGRSACRSHGSRLRGDRRISFGLHLRLNRGSAPCESSVSVARRSAHSVGRGDDA
jgi:hypothetical protein